MKNKTIRMINAFRSLNPEERQEFINYIQNETPQKELGELKKRLDETRTRDFSLVLGPLDTACPFCGK